MTDFVHLHVHSDYSLSSSIASVKELVAKAASLGMKHLAITDDNMFGVPKFQRECENQGIHPIIGRVFNMAYGSRFEKDKSKVMDSGYPLILLAANIEGYRNLVKLSSCTEDFNRIDKGLLTQYPDGLIGIFCCMARDISKSDLGEIEKQALGLRTILGDGNVYLELCDQYDEPEKVNPIIIDISRRTGIPLAATNKVNYIEKEDVAAYSVLLYMKHSLLYDEPDRKLFELPGLHFKSGDEMAASFPDYPEAIANTVRIAERCNVVLPELKPQLPVFDIPQGFTNADEYIRHLAMNGLKRRYFDKANSVMERVEQELGIIIQMGFSNYFLIVADFTNWAREHDIPVGPGRGSAPSSIVAYALGITNIDPIKYNLLFERFINPERPSLPDFDIDFSNEDRAKVVNYVTEKYGRNRVGQIVTFGIYRVRKALYDVGCSLQIPEKEIDMIADLIPKRSLITLSQSLEREPKLRELEQNPKYRELFTLAGKLEGRKYFISFHAAGIIISKTDLSDYVPLYRDPETGTIASQFTIDELERYGVVKFDLLSLNILDTIKHTEELIRKRGAQYADFSINTIPLDDKPTFAIISEGKTEGVFQFESEGMQEVLQQAKPGCINDLIMLNALYRPGPMEYIPLLIDRRNGRQAVEYPDPCLEDILKETYGIILYQEQVMLIIQRIAGYSLAQADSLRRILGKRKPDEMNVEKERFVSTARKQGFTETDAERIFEILVPVAEWAFNKSHAAAYSLLAYQTAYLKVNFPDEFAACGSD
jgi:DNA polymerase-3 subunit alpha